MVKAIANANIALIKYWGKIDKDHNLAATPSISLTLSGHHTKTSVKIKKGLKNDQIYLNKQLVDDTKIIKFIDEVRRISKVDKHVVIKTSNNFPTAAGFASSASGFAALAIACNKEFNLALNHDKLARLARLGSGSATRSLDGGLVAWPLGNDVNSFGREILSPEKIPLAIVSFFTEKKSKKISSTKGMQVVQNTSPYFPEWIQEAKKDYQKALNYIKKNNWLELLKLAQSNALKMHATNITADPPLIYFEPETIALMKQIIFLQETKKIPFYFTIDAGPNVKLLTFKDKLHLVKKYFSNYQYDISLPGTGAYLID